MRMYKTIIDNEMTESLIIGTAREIKSLYATMVKKGFYPVFSDEPKFNYDRSYGLSYRNNGDTFEDGITVVSATMALMILEDF